jgi:hypothetical protein
LIQEASTRADNARHVIAGFTVADPTLIDLWRQIDDSLADVPVLTTEIVRTRRQLARSRLDRANLAAAGQATIAAWRNSEADPLSYLRDELAAQGFGRSA